MLLLDHVSIAVRDLGAARPFYDAIMLCLGARKVYDHDHALGYGERCSERDPRSSYLAVYAAPDAIPHARRHWCFKADSRAVVDRFYEAGVAAGGVCDGPPALRSAYHAAYYAAFLYDPDGNRLEAVHHLEPAPAVRPENAQDLR